MTPIRDSLIAPPWLPTLLAIASLLVVLPIEALMLLELARMGSLASVLSIERLFVLAIPLALAAPFVLYAAWAWTTPSPLVIDRAAGKLRLGRASMDLAQITGVTVVSTRIAVEERKALDLEWDLVIKRGVGAHAIALLPSRREIRADRMKWPMRIGAQQLARVLGVPYVDG
ncbi:hypothetical protein [Sandaracinus amylolyticus]|nr:hypothetical protein [Sandaracinus amylolyticus]